MNENKRILLLALGIMAIVASDPPVGTAFDRPHSVCTIARDLAVSAFDSLVRSTLPPSASRPEGERTDEVLVADASIVGMATRPSVANPYATAEPGASVLATTASEVEIVRSSADVIQSACSGATGPVRVLRVEAVMQVNGQAIRG